MKLFELSLILKYLIVVLMGSRGVFVNADTKNFDYVECGQTYHSIDEVDGFEVLIRGKGSTKAPDYFHFQIMYMQ